MISMSDTISTHPGLEALADGFFMLDTEWRIAYWNAAAVRMFGVPRDRAVGRGLWSVVPASERTLLEPKLRDAMGGREPAEFVIPHLPGCCRGHYSVRAVPIGESGIAVHLRDATDETKLAERYSQLLESIRDAFVAVDPDGSISYINHVAERLLRLSRGDALGTRVWKLVPPNAPQIESCLRAALEDGMPRKLRRIPMDTGKPRGRFIDMWVHPLPGGGLSVLFQDVTRRVRREKDLSRYAAEADEANRAKSRFFAAVSHELRTPLNAIVGYTHLLTTDTYGAMPGGAVRAASRASVCAEHLAHLIDDLLMMTTAEIDRLPVTSSPVVIADFLRTALEPVRQQAEAKGLRFAIEFDGDARRWIPTPPGCASCSSPCSPTPSSSRTAAPSRFGCSALPTRPAPARMRRRTEPPRKRIAVCGSGSPIRGRASRLPSGSGSSRRSSNWVTRRAPTR